MTSVPSPMPVWKLDGHTPVRCDDFLEWVEWKAHNPETWIVAQGTVGDSWVSTVFLGVSSALPGVEAPALFETMIFGGLLDRKAWRYSTWDEAAEGHERAVSTLRQMAKCDG